MVFRGKKAFGWGQLVLLGVLVIQSSAFSQNQLSEVEKARTFFQNLEVRDSYFDELKSSELLNLFYEVSSFSKTTRFYVGNDFVHLGTTEVGEQKIPLHNRGWYDFRVQLPKGYSVTNKAKAFLTKIYHHPNLTLEDRAQIDRSIKRELDLAWRTERPESKDFWEIDHLMSALQKYSYSSRVNVLIERMIQYYWERGDCSSIVNLMRSYESFATINLNSKITRSSLLFCSLMVKHKATWLVSQESYVFLKKYDEELNSNKEEVSEMEKVVLDVMPFDADASLFERLEAQFDIYQRTMARQKPRKDLEPLGEWVEVEQVKYKRINEVKSQNGFQYVILSQENQKREKSSPVYLGIFDQKTNRPVRLVFISRHEQPKKISIHFEDSNVYVFSASAFYVSYSRYETGPPLRVEIVARGFDRWGNAFDADLKEAEKLIDKYPKQVVYYAAIAETFRALDTNIFTYASSKFYHFDREVLPYCFEMLKTGGLIQKRYALKLIAQLNSEDPGYVKHVMPFLIDKNLEIRFSAIQALNRFEKIPVKFKKQIEYALDPKADHWENVIVRKVNEDTAIYTSLNLTVESVKEDAEMLSMYIEGKYAKK